MKKRKMLGALDYACYLGHWLGRCGVTKGVAHEAGLTRREADAVAWGISEGITICRELALGVVDPGEHAVSDESAVTVLLTALDMYALRKGDEPEIVVEE